MASRMLRTAKSGVALVRTVNICSRQPVSAWIAGPNSSIRLAVLTPRAPPTSASNISLTEFSIKPKVPRINDYKLYKLSHKFQIDKDRQRLPTFFDEDGTKYMLEVSAPRNLAFDAVWSSIGHWLKYHAEHEWSEENLEFVRKAVSRASTICLLRMVKDKDVTIVPVANEEEAKNLSDACDQGTYFFDIGGGLRELKNQLDAGAVHEAQQVQFRGPYDLEHDIGHGIKIRLCNSIFAAEYSAGK